MKATDRGLKIIKSHHMQITKQHGSSKCGNSKDFSIPRKEFCNNRKIWRTGDSSHKENYIWMSDSFHDPDLAQAYK